MEALELKDTLILETISGMSNCSVQHGVHRGRHVALKTLKSDDPDLRRSLEHEVCIWSSLNDHPNVLRLIGFSKSLYILEASYRDVCIVSEYMPYGSVESYLKRLDRFDVKKLLKIALGAAIGLEYVHSKGIIHRDVKLDNFLVDEKLNVKIMDFGFSERVEEPTRRRVYTKAYAAPEVLQMKNGIPKHGTFSDVYSFGVCLDQMYHLVIKHSPKDAFPLAIRQLRDWCMEKEPCNRPSMIKVVDILKKVDLRKNEPKMIDQVPHHAYRPSPNPCRLIQGLIQRVLKV